MLFYNEIFLPVVIFMIFFFAISLWLFGLYNRALAEKQKIQEKYNKELHHRKSSEVRLGKIGENLAPFTKEWPWDPNNFRFLGNPVDGVQFNDDEIIFVEIKTGGARLSRSQKTFRDIVKAGKVTFVTFKITDNGTKLLWEPTIID